jgi:hypothetical protein
LVLSALLILPAFSAIISIDSVKVESYNGTAPVGAFSIYLGNRTCAGVAANCDANFTMFFDLYNYTSLSITNFRIKHAFQVPSGGVGWTATGVGYTIPAITGLAESIGNISTQVVWANADCFATNATGGSLFAPNSLVSNNTYTDFNCTLPVSSRYLAVTWARTFDGTNANALTENRGTSVFGKNWAIMEFSDENISGSNLTLGAVDWNPYRGGFLTVWSDEIILASYEFRGCSPTAASTNFECQIGVAMPNGTVVASTNWTGMSDWNHTCTPSNPIVSKSHYLPESESLPYLPLGLYQVVAECYKNGNASDVTVSNTVWIDSTAPVTTTTIAVVTGLTGNAIAIATTNATVYWGNWLISNIYLIFGLFFAVIVLIIFLVLSAEFNLPILATAGFIIAAFIALVTLILTSPAGLLILIVMVLLLLVIGAFAIFKGMSA